MTRSRTTPREPGQDTRPSRLRITERGKTVAILGASALAITSAILLNNAMNGGSEDPTKFGDIDPTISSVTINPGAAINHDPYVSTADNNNLVDVVRDHELTVETPEGAYLREKTNNGDWAGLTLAQIQEVDPSFVPGPDKDGVFWVNLGNDAASAERQAD